MMWRTVNLATRRSFVLVSVLVITTSALLVATSLIFAVQTQVMGEAVTADATQVRALAWSGLQAVMSRLNEQRDSILAGETPQLEEQYIIYETPTRFGIVRLIPTSHSRQELLVAESGKLDLNAATAESLASTGMTDAAIAQTIISYRDQTLKRPFQSIAELLGVPGANISPELLYGPIEEIKLLDAAQRGELSINERVSARLATPAAQGLNDVLGVHNIEPALQQNGKRQINLNVPWSDDLARAIEERFGSEIVPLIKQIYDRGERFESDAKIIKALRDFKVEPENWPGVLDAFTTQSGEYHYGRLDINTAPVEALMGLPGVTPEQASQMVSIRDELSPQERATVAWPAMTQILSPDLYDRLIGKITTRSFTYRVRIAAGEVDAEDANALMSHRMVYEAVIDLASPTPRVAYLRDITQLQVTAEIASQQPSDFDLALDKDDAEVELDSPATVPSQASQPATRPTMRASAVPNASAQPPPVAPASNEANSRKQQRIGRWTTGSVN